MKLLVSRGADPKINTKLGVTPLAVAAGIGWVEGVTKERSPAESSALNSLDRKNMRASCCVMVL